MKLRFQNHYEETQTLEVSNLGKGTFTKAYKVDGEDKVILVTSDPMKEICKIIKGIHVPELSHIGYKQESEVYESPLYFKIEPRTNAWAHMQTLKKLMKSPSMAGIVRDVTDEQVEALDIPDTLRSDLLNILNWASSYDHEARFEISPRNVKVDAEGNLILLDVVFSLTKLLELRRPSW